RTPRGLGGDTFPDENSGVGHPATQPVLTDSHVDSNRAFPDIELQRKGGVVNEDIPGRHARTTPVLAVPTEIDHHQHLELMIDGPRHLWIAAESRMRG